MKKPSKRGLKDERGNRYGRLLVESLDATNPRPCAWWVCICDCGQMRTLRGTDLRRGKVKSCGCLKRDLQAKRLYRHGFAGTPTYASWKSMNDRCCKPATNGYDNYGGRGIKVCNRWSDANDSGVVNFVEDMGRRPRGCTIDRIDPDGDYTPSNCRWATDKEQRNNMRTAVTFRGETKSLTEWGRGVGISQTTMHARINKHGWSMEKALTTPIRGKA